MLNQNTNINQQQDDTINFQLTGYDSDFELNKESQSIIPNDDLKVRMDKLGFKILKNKNTYYLACQDTGKALDFVYQKNTNQQNNTQYIKDIMQTAKEVINIHNNNPMEQELNIKKFAIMCHGDAHTKFVLNKTQRFTLDTYFEILTEEGYLNNVEKIISNACHAGKDMSTKQTTAQNYEYHIPKEKSKNIQKIFNKLTHQPVFIAFGNKHINFNIPLDILNDFFDDKKDISVFLKGIIKNNAASIHLFHHNKQYNSHQLNKLPNFKLFNQRKPTKQEVFFQLTKQEQAQYIVNKMHKHMLDRYKKLMYPYTQKLKHKPLELSKKDILQYMIEDLRYFSTKENKSFQNSQKDYHIKFILENPQYIIDALKPDAISKNPQDVKRRIAIDKDEINRIKAVLKYCMENNISLDKAIKYQPYNDILPKAKFLIDNISTLKDKYSLKPNQAMNTINRYDVKNYFKNINHQDNQHPLTIKEQNLIKQTSAIINHLYNILPQITEFQGIKGNILTNQDHLNFYSMRLELLLPKAGFSDIGLNAEELCTIIQNTYDKNGSMLNQNRTKHKIQTRQDVFNVLNKLAHDEITRKINKSFDRNGEKFTSYTQKNNPPMTYEEAMQVVKNITKPNGPNGTKYTIHGIKHLLFTKKQLEDKIGITDDNRYEIIKSKTPSYVQKNIYTKTQVSQKTNQNNIKPSQSKKYKKITTKLNRNKNYSTKTNNNKLNITNIKQKYANLGLWNNEYKNKQQQNTQVYKQRQKTSLLREIDKISNNIKQQNTQVYKQQQDSQIREIDKISNNIKQQHKEVYNSSVETELADLLLSKEYSQQNKQSKKPHRNPLQQKVTNIPKNKNQQNNNHFTQQPSNDDINNTPKKSTNIFNKMLSIFTPNANKNDAVISNETFNNTIKQTYNIVKEKLKSTYGIAKNSTTAFFSKLKNFLSSQEKSNKNDSHISPQITFDQTSLVPEQNINEQKSFAAKHTKNQKSEQRYNSSVETNLADLLLSKEYSQQNTQSTKSNQNTYKPSKAIKSHNNKSRLQYKYRPLKPNKNTNSTFNKRPHNIKGFEKPNRNTGR
ncbi:MAG: hypothetical protein AAFO15_00910 [Pseudomonadota bacterium]